MAVKASRVTVGTTATRLDVTVEADKVNESSYASLRGNGKSVHVEPIGADIYWGGPDVTTSNGVRLRADVAETFDLLPGDALYGIVASGTVSCYVGEVGV